MTTNPTADEAARSVSNEGRRRYAVAAALLCIGLVVAVVVGLVGATGPGLLGVESAFLVAGLAILCTAAAVVFILVTYYSFARRLEGRVQHQEAIEQAAHDELTLRDERQLNELQLARQDAQRTNAQFHGAIQELGRQTTQLKDTDNYLRQDIDAFVALPTRLEDHEERLAGLEARSTSNEDANERLDAHTRRLATLDEKADALESRFVSLVQKQQGWTVQVDQRIQEALVHTDTVAAEQSDIRRRLSDIESNLLELLNAVRGIEELRRHDEHFRTEIEAFQNRLGEEHQRLEQQVAEVAAAKENLEGLRGALGKEQEQRVKLFQELEGTRAALDRLTQQLSAHSGHAVLDLAHVNDRLERLEHSGQAVVTPRPVTNGGPPLAIIEGIGDVYQERLKEAGILTLADLRAAPPEKVASTLRTHPKRVRSWQAMAELMELPGIGPQSAEMLVVAGIQGVEALANADPETVMRRIDETNERRQIRVMPGQILLADLVDWTQAARRARSVAPRQ